MSAVDDNTSSAALRISPAPVSLVMASGSSTSAKSEQMLVQISSASCKQLQRTYSLALKGWIVPLEIATHTKKGFVPEVDFSASCRSRSQHLCDIHGDKNDVDDAITIGPDTSSALGPSVVGGYVMQ